MVFRFSTVFCIAISLFWVGTTSTAETAKEFYEGKTIRWIIPYRPGGGYDEYSRLIEPFFEKYTGANIDLVNMPGTASIKGSIEVFRAPSDGLHLGLLNGSTLITNMIATGASADFDMSRFSYVGQVANEEIILVLSSESSFSDLSDVLGAGTPLVFGATGRKGSSYMDAAIFSQAFGVETKIISGFDSSSDIRMALLRGDVDASWNSYGTQMKLVRDGAAVAVMRSGQGPMAGLDGLPSIVDYLPDMAPDMAELVQGWLAVSTMGRLVLGPPGVPKDRLDFLEAALEMALSDPEFQEKVKASGRTLSFLSGESVRAMADQALNADAAVLATLRETLTGR